jgi:hypothetical protein
MMSFLEAIARAEGWLDLKSRPRRNNNPGDIEYGRFAIAHGATGSDGRFAIFPTPEAGFAAMRVLLEAPAYRGLTVAQVIAKWAPSNENDTARYIANVCTWAGCKAGDVIDALVQKVSCTGPPVAFIRGVNPLGN